MRADTAHRRRLCDLSAHGFTLLELLIVVAILAALAPAFVNLRELLANQRAAAAQQQILSQVQFARSAAVTLHAPTTLCPVREKRCTSDWSARTTVFIDRNQNRQQDQNEPVLSHFESFPPGSTVSWRAFGSRRALQFTALGTTRYQNGTFTWCPADGNPRHRRAVIVSVPGRPRIAADSNRDGIREDARGRPLRC